MTDAAIRFEELLSYASEPDPALNVGGAGLFVPELVLGPGNLHPDDEAAIASRLVEVARARKVPLHACVAWNCLHFGYDPAQGGYDEDICRGMELPSVVPGRDTEALPVGALVIYSSGAAHEHLEWAEVLYKEGRPSGAIDDDDLVRPEYSGAVGIPGAAAGDDPVLSELLVLDFAPFGPLPAKAQNWLDRACDDQSRPYIDELGHISVEACYPSFEAAERSDTEYFCDWMLKHHRKLLAEGWIGAALDDPEDQEHLAEALANSLDAIEAVLERSRAFGEWNGYWYLIDEYEALAHDQDAPGGPSDAWSMVTSLARVPDDRRIAYHPFSLLLQRFVDPEHLRYKSYVRYAVMTGVLVAQTLTERAPDGILTVRDVNYVVRRDDCWLYSGVWRAERLEEGMSCSLVGFPATVTLGLGATGEAGHYDEVLPTEPDDVARSDEEEPGANAPTDTGVCFWTVTLRASHREEQRMYLDPAARLVPGEDGTIVLRLSHRGDIAEEEKVQCVCLSADGAWLSPVQFPLDFFTGIRLSCLARSGASSVRAATQLLPEPVEVAGGLYDFAFDRSIIDPSRPRIKPLSLEQLALRALIRHGEDAGAGWRRLGSPAITELVFGEDPGEDAVTAVAEALKAGGRAHFERGYWFCWVRDAGRHRRPTQEGEGGFFTGASAALGASVERAAARHRREHRVVLHLRKLWVSDEASKERQAAYVELRESAPNRASLPPRLPEGYTYVIAHTRGRREQP